MKNSSYFNCSAEIQYNNNNNNVEMSLNCSENYGTLMYAGMSHLNFINMSNQGEIQRLYETHNDFKKGKEELNNAFICNQQGQCQPNPDLFSRVNVMARFGLSDDTKLCTEAVGKEMNPSDPGYNAALDSCKKMIGKAGDELCEAHGKILKEIFIQLNRSKVAISRAGDLVDFARAIAGVVERTCAPSEVCEVKNETGDVEAVPGAGDLGMFANRFANGFLAYDIYI